jgi:hypothetical protein
VPNWRSSDFGLPNPPQSFPSFYEFKGDTAWRDSERDADGDGLNNWLESVRGPSNNDWWRQYWADDSRFAPPIETWKEKAYCTLPGEYKQRPGYFDQRPFENVDLADPDVDGDSLLDGEDDQDNDDVINIVELYETIKDVDGNGQPTWCGYTAGLVPSINLGGFTAAVNPFNPCAPNMDSRSCDDFVPF